MKFKITVVIVILMSIALFVTVNNLLDYTRENSELEKTIKQMISNKAEDLEKQNQYKKTTDEALESLLKLFEDEKNTSRLFDEKNSKLEKIIKEKEAALLELSLPDPASRYRLEEMGISDVAVLSESLVALGADIISYKGVLGGTMYFYGVKILNNKWAFARFEDGHYGGYGLYEFELKDQIIHWKMVAEFTDN